MLKNKFYKNLFQSLSALGGIIVVYIPCIFGYIESIKYESDLGWIMLVAPLSLFIFGVLSSLPIYFSTKSKFSIATYNVASSA